ncbi:dimethylglycine dehydrogenase, mitochondrial precursor, putative [Brugia malayi]|uniref:Bm6398, isoform c n=1 Tax=Brugia malayi TaxID=6279 RepID=A0A4E9FJA5_BRUMA|nr:dimethylglycine dehydrogenase, mitochondrial precursor, putative [Brugia malayi]VIO97081.1 dimethylglycine dehydrogenase, mitochondrial precursor, putative [Brugia malayi]
MFALLKTASRKRQLTEQARKLCRHLSEVPKDAFALIVGGGVVGTSLAYHLTLRGIRDVVLLERGKLVDGISLHLPGLVSSAHPIHRYKPFLAWSVELYVRLQEEADEKLDFFRPGTLRLATDEARLDEFRQYTARDYFQKGDVAKTTLIDANKVKHLAPILDAKTILGALYTSGDGYINAQNLTLALAKGAEKRGAVLIEQCPKITEVEEGKTDWVVKFDDGRQIRTRNIVNAAGLWAREFGRLTNLDIPLAIVEHQFARIGPLPEVEPLLDLPAIIDHESTFYIHREGDSLLFGGFEQKPSDVVIREDWIERMPEEVVIEPDFKRLKRAYERACDLIPCLRGVNVDARASVVTMMADGYPLVGPINHKQNYWLQAGYFDGISSGGGMGKYLADWIIDGEPPSELFDTDANRFDRWVTRDYIIDKCRETYSMFYNWSYKNRLAGRPTERISGIYGRLQKEGCFYLFRNGWEVAESFAAEYKDKLPNMIREYELVSNKCGVIDLSWRGKIEVRGKDSEKLLSYVLANEPPQLGEVSSGLMLTKKGNIFGSLDLFHHDQYRSEFILLTDPERESRELNWLKRAAIEMEANVEISGVSEYLASLAIVGPKSREVLEELTKSDLGFKQNAARLMRLGSAPVIAVRTTDATGQLSYELYHSRGDTLGLYNSLMEVGKNYGIVNFGQSTLNMMRIENGYKIWGRELTLNTNPYECGLSQMVDLNKENFIGKTSCMELSQKQWNRKQVLLICEPLTEPQSWRMIPKRMEVIRKEGSEDRVGQITSGTFSVRLHRPLAFAWVHSDITPEDNLWIDIGGSQVQGRIHEGSTVCGIEETKVSDDAVFRQS